MKKKIYNSENLYDEVYLFFVKKNANDIVFDYINKGADLAFNSDSLFITTNNDRYTIKVEDKNGRYYWNIIASNGQLIKTIRCNNGNLEDVFEEILENHSI